MTRVLRYSRRSLRDSEDIGDRIFEGGNPDRALSFVRELRLSCDGLLEFPEAAMLRPEYGTGVRVVPFGCFLILYRWFEDRRVLRIERVVGAVQRARPA